MALLDRSAARALMCALFLTLSGGAAPPKPHLGVVTGCMDGARDDSLGAQFLLQRYGSVSSGGQIQYIHYPDAFLEDRENYLAGILELARDPDMKAIVVNQAIPGTAEAFKRVHAIRPDIYCLAGEAHEDANIITAAADFVSDQDFVSRGYTIIWAAKEMGAQAFVHVSFPRHMGYRALGLRRVIMEEACKDLGLRFAYEAAPDPAGPGGDPEWRFFTENVPRWVRKYGPEGQKVAVFCTCDAHTAPLIRHLLETRNGIFVEADLPSPLMGYPTALDLSVPFEPVDIPAFLKKVESAVVARGGAGRFGTWAFSYGATVTAGLGEYALRVVTGRAKRNDLKDLVAAYESWTPGARWRATLYRDPTTGTTYDNLVTVYMDTYILGGLNGKKFLPTTRLQVPGKFLFMKQK